MARPPGNSFSIMTGTPNVSAAGLECWGKVNRWLTPPAGNLSGSALSIGKPASRAGIYTGARLLCPPTQSLQT
jgi:hypothetical protein